MEDITFKINFSSIGDHNLRFNCKFFDPNSLENKTLDLIKSRYPYKKIRQLQKKIGQGSSIRILDTIPDGDVGLITIENINKYSLEINSSEIKYVPKSIVKKNLLLQKNDIITPRVRGLGNIALIEDNNQFIASENVLYIRFKDQFIEKYGSKFLAYYLATIGRLQISLLQTGGEAGNINQNLLKEIIIPDVGEKIRENILNKVEKIEEKIESLKENLTTLQDIIESVFIKYSVKKDFFELSDYEIFNSNFSDIGNQKFLKIGAGYRYFNDIQDSNLFSSTDYPVAKLNTVMKLNKTRQLKKGILDKQYILVELEDIEQRTGEVKYDKVVDEIGSNKVYFGDSEIITTKLRPYLGYTFLNDSSFELIGSTELLPFKVDKSVVFPDFIRYLLLSPEYLEKSKYLMYGKEHPRIHPIDIININVPLPDKKIQENIISEIRKRELINNKNVQQLEKYKEEINKIFIDELLIN